ncbi:MAG: hypothetical protein ABI647_16785, partial [Gemmatimonadota bacterium]
MTEPTTRLVPPRLVYRIGVVGHRWNKLGGTAAWRDGPHGIERSNKIEAVLTERLRQVLASIRVAVEAIGAESRPAYQSAGPGTGFKAELVIVSALAEGADRLVAKAGVAEGYCLDVILPFAAPAYEEDFDERWAAKSWSRPGALAEFHDLLGMARTTVTADGILGRDDRYGPLSRMVVEHSDLVIALWDRGPTDGVGGTADALATARRYEVPIIRVDYELDQNDEATAWLERPNPNDDGRAGGLAGFGAVLERSLKRPPASHDHRGRLDLLDDFFSEQIPPGRLGKAYDVMVKWLMRPGSRWLPTFLMWPRVLARVTQQAFDQDPVGAAMREWRGQWASVPVVPEPLRERLCRELAPTYAWADRFATYYANRYRSAYTTVFSLTWVAVVAAVIGLGANMFEADLFAKDGRGPTPGVLEWLVPATGVVELVVLMAIAGLVWWGSRQRFHEKWVDYRSLAERFRHLTFLWPLGRSSGFARAPQANDPNDPRRSWFAWLFRARVRELGLFGADFTPPHFDGCRHLLLDHELEEQRDYHRRNIDKMSRMYHFAHGRTEWLFYAAALLAFAHLGHWVYEQVTHPGHHPNTSEDLLIAIAFAAVAVFLPSRAAALHGWVGQGDFLGSALRSAELQYRLAEVQRIGRSLTEVSSHTLGDVAIDAARVMEGDLAAWDAVSR